MLAMQLETTIEALNAVTREVEQRFGGLSSDEINRRTNPDSWSVGQCLEHLILSNELYYPDLDAIASGTHRNSFWQKWSPFSVFGARLLIYSQKSDGRRYKVPIESAVPPSDAPADIVVKFAAHHEVLISKLVACADADPYRTVITSPFMKFLTYRLVEVPEIIVEHERRHVRQAGRVLESIANA